MNLSDTDQAPYSAPAPQTETVSDEAVQAARNAYRLNYAYGKYDVAMTAALTAAIPHLTVSAEPCSVEITPADAVFGIMAWLSGRNEVVALSASHGAAIAAELASEFCKENDLRQFSENYPKNLKYPTNTLSQPIYTGGK